MYSPIYLWFFYPLFGWGLGLFFHAMKVFNFMPFLNKEWEAKKIKEFILKQALGNLIGFIVGMWVTALFSHRVLERKGFHNLFGLAGRRKVVVNEIPEWLQNGIAIIVGFIVLELINHFFQTKQHIAAWRCFKRLLGKRIA